MTQSFTASEVRELVAHAGVITRDRIGEALHDYANRLEADEKAVPVAYAEFADNGCVRMWSRGYEERLPGTRMIPLYTHPAPSDADRLAEALRVIRQHVAKDPSALADSIIATCDNALAAHSAQAQPPAASVTDAMVGRAQDCLHDKGKDIGYYHMRAALEAALAAQENPNG